MKQAVKPRIVLVTPPVEDAASFAPLLRSACSGADVAAVILRLATGSDDAQIRRVQHLTAALPDDGPILVIDGHARLVTKSGADGVHLKGSSLAADARRAMPDRTVGVGSLSSRHDAMIAGESGADYVLFGEPGAEGRRPGFDALIERIEWWSELFIIPCVGYAGSLDEIEPIARAGADFIALGEEAVWRTPEGPARALAMAAVQLAVLEAAQ